MADELRFSYPADINPEAVALVKAEARGRGVRVISFPAFVGDSCGYLVAVKSGDLACETLVDAFPTEGFEDRLRAAVELCDRRIRREAN